MTKIRYNQMESTSSMIPNLNAQFLQGATPANFATAAQGALADDALPASSFTQAAVYDMVLASSTGHGAGLNADMVDSKHAPSGAIVGTTDTQELSAKTMRDLKIVGNPPKIIGNAAGTANISQLEFYENNGTTRVGFVGDYHSGESSIGLVAETGNVILYPKTNGMKAKAVYNGNTYDIFHAGNLLLATTTASGLMSFTDKSNLDVLWNAANTEDTYPPNMTEEILMLQGANPKVEFKDAGGVLRGSIGWSAADNKIHLDSLEIIIPSNVTIGGKNAVRSVNGVSADVEGNVVVETSSGGGDDGGIGKQYYVDNTNGNDANSGTSSSPLRTINVALSKIPKIVYGDHYITIVGPHSEHISIKGYMGSGSIGLYGDTGQEAIGASTNYPSIIIDSCACNIRIAGIKCNTLPYTGGKETEYENFIEVSNCNYVYVGSCGTTPSGDPSAYLLAKDGSYIKAENNVIDRAGIAIRADDGSFIVSTNNTGTGNGTGLYSKSAIIMKNGSQPGATTAESKYYGGQIW